MLNQLVEYFYKIFEQPKIYRSKLEEYIISNDPQNSFDIDRLIRQYDSNQSKESY